MRGRGGPAAASFLCRRGEEGSGAGEEKPGPLPAGREPCRRTDAGPPPAGAGSRRRVGEKGLGSPGSSRRGRGAARVSREGMGRGEHLPRGRCQPGLPPRLRPARQGSAGRAGSRAGLPLPLARAVPRGGCRSRLGGRAGGAWPGRRAAVPPRRVGAPRPAAPAPA